MQPQLKTMSGHGSTSKGKAVSRPSSPLTPSSSPSRPPLPARTPDKDKAPPSKRPRLTATPLSSIGRSRSSLLPNDYAKEIHEMRKAASLRLLNTWSQLGDQYTRPLDQDDIIDLRDWSIVEDHGVLRGLSKKYEVGCFAGGSLSTDANDASSDGGTAGGEDDDADELDAFAPEANISDEIELEKERRHVPPVQEMDPADAQDLREFLEAEQRRKEMFGDPDEEEVAMDPVSLRLPQAPKTPDKRATSQPRSKSRSRGRRTSDAPRAGQQARAPRSLPHIDSLGDDPFENYVSSSEDELAVWAVDTSTPARPRKPRPSQVNDIIDVMSSPSPSPPPVRCTKSRGPTQNASRQPSPPRARSIPRGRSKTPAQRKTNMSPPPIPQSSKSQLLTPPPSVQSCTPDIVSHSDPVVPHFPSPPLRPKPRPRYKSAVSHAEIGVTEASRALLRPHNAKKATTSTKLLRQATLGPSNAASTSRLVAEVAIPYNPGASMPFKNIQRVSPKRSARRIADDSDTDIAATRVDKGKGKQRSSTTNLGDPGEHELPARHASSASALRLANEPPSPGSARQRRAKSAAPLRSRKRKRVVSLSPSSGSGESENDDQDLASYPNYYRSQTRDDQPGPSSRRASYGVPARRARSQPRSADESDGDGHRRHSRAHHALHVPSSDSFSSMHSPIMSYMPRVNEQYPPPMTHDPQWYYQIVQMWHHLAYLLHSSPGMSGFQGSKPAYPPPFAMPSPRHRQLHSERRQAVESLYDASTSRLSSFDAAPMSDIPLPPFTSAFSDGTLPPSSPLSGTSGRSSSGPSSPVLRSQSVARGRSKSVGRRVSFMMSSSDRPVIPTSAADLSSDDEVAFLAVPQRARSRSRQVIDRDDRAGGQEKGKGTGLTRSSSLKLTGSMGTPRLSEKAKGKQRADDEEEAPPSESGGCSDVGRWERGRTPGPPGQRAKSMFGRLGGGR